MANQSQQQLNTVNHGSDHALTALSFLVKVSVCLVLSVRVCGGFNVLKKAKDTNTVHTDNNSLKKSDKTAVKASLLLSDIHT